MFGQLSILGQGRLHELPSGTTDKLEGRTWGTERAMALRGTWQKWKGVRVITERGDRRWAI